MSDALAYARQLLGKLHGYPLWVPEPYGHSAVYRTKGVRIGDVGYVTQDGAFETLFNIRAPADHPVNRRGVPEKFEQVDISQDDIVFLRIFHNKDSAVTSLSAQQRSLGSAVSTTQNPVIPVGAGAGFEYSWSTSEGAILHLPQGGSRLSAPEDLFRGQALKHAINWYKFVALTLHRRIANGSLYLVTGCDKAPSWMVGTFSDSSSESRVAIQLSGSGLVEGQASYSYVWSSSSPPIYRVGPGEDGAPIPPIDMEALDRDDDLFSADAPDSRNQCVFIRGYRIALKRSVMAQILGGTTQIQLSAIEDSKPGELTRSRSDFSGLMKTLSRSSHDGSSSFGTQRSAGSSSTWDFDDLVIDNDESSQVLIDSIPGHVEPYHPAMAINEFILDCLPDSDVAVTHDNDWARVMSEDGVLPANKSLLFRFLQQFQICRSSDGVYPTPKENSPNSSEGIDLMERVHSKKTAQVYHNDSECWTCQMRLVKCELDWEVDACVTCRNMGIFCLAGRLGSEDLITSELPLLEATDQNHPRFPSSKIVELLGEEQTDPNVEPKSADPGSIDWPEVKGLIEVFQQHKLSEASQVPLSSYKDPESELHDPVQLNKRLASNSSPPPPYTEPFVPEYSESLQMAFGLRRPPSPSPVSDSHLPSSTIDTGNTSPLEAPLPNAPYRWKFGSPFQYAMPLGHSPYSSPYTFPMSSASYSPYTPPNAVDTHPYIVHPSQNNSPGPFVPMTGYSNQSYMGPWGYDSSAPPPAGPSWKEPPYVEYSTDKPSGNAVGHFAAGADYGPVLSPLQTRLVKATLQINPLFERSIPEDAPPKLEWNLLNLLVLEQKAVKPFLHQPATFPRVSLVRIISRGLPFVITARAGDESQGVTCEDIIHSIYKNLQMQVGRDVFEAQSVETRKALQYNYHHLRSSPFGGPLGVGLKRLDFLDKAVLFNGLQTDPELVEAIGREDLPCTLRLRRRDLQFVKAT